MLFIFLRQIVLPHIFTQPELKAVKYIKGKIGKKFFLKIEKMLLLGFQICLFL